MYTVALRDEIRTWVLIQVISTPRSFTRQPRTRRSYLPCGHTQCTTLVSRLNPAGAPLRSAALTRGGV